MHEQKHCVGEWVPCVCKCMYEPCSTGVTASGVSGSLGSCLGLHQQVDTRVASNNFERVVRQALLHHGSDRRLQALVYTVLRDCITVGWSAWRDFFWLGFGRVESGCGLCALLSCTLVGRGQSQGEAGSALYDSISCFDGMANTNTTELLHANFNGVTSFVKCITVCRRGAFLPEVREFIRDTKPRTNTRRGGRRARHPKTTLPYRPPGTLL